MGLEGNPLSLSNHKQVKWVSVKKERSGARAIREKESEADVQKSADQDQLK